MRCYYCSFKHIFYIGTVRINWLYLLQSCRLWINFETTLRTTQSEFRYKRYCFNKMMQGWDKSTIVWVTSNLELNSAQKLLAVHLSIELPVGLTVGDNRSQFGGLLSSLWLLLRWGLFSNNPKYRKVFGWLGLNCQGCTSLVVKIYWGD